MRARRIQFVLDGYKLYRKTYALTMGNTEEEDKVAKNAIHGASNRQATAPDKTPRWVVVFGVVAAALFLCFVVLHLTGRGLGHHGSGSGAQEHIESTPGKLP